MILCFTGTGNSRYCADFLADRLGDEVVDLNEKIRNKDYSALKSDKAFILCAPTYAWRVPRVVSAYLEKTSLEGSKELYFVMTCGGEIGKAEKYNKDVCDSLNKKYMGTAEIKMPENYIAMFDSPTQEQEDKLMKRTDKLLEGLSSLIKNDESLPPVKANATASVLSGVVNGLFYTLFVKDKKFTVTENCVSCSLCVKKCPLGNIELKDGKPVWQGNCTHCMACISYCPKEAIEYGKKSEGQRRYRCRSFE